MSKSIDEVMEALSTAFCANDASAIAELYAPNATCSHPAIGGGDHAYIGRPKIRTGLMEFMAAFPDMTYQVQRIVHDGANACIMMYTWSGTHSAPFGCCQTPFGKHVNDIWTAKYMRIADGLIVESMTIMDHGGLVNALTPQTKQDEMMLNLWKIRNIWMRSLPVSQLSSLVSSDFASECLLHGMMDTKQAMKHIEMFLDAFPDLSMDWHMVPGVESNEILCNWTMQGTFTNEILNRKPTNRRVVLSGYSTFFFNDSLEVSHVKDYYDTNALLQQLDGKKTVSPPAKPCSRFGIRSEQQPLAMMSSMMEGLMPGHRSHSQPHQQERNEM
eukprot:164984_1